ncbi:hypothetical protein BU24DRAFT_428504 [Aaosphaeria arxii CBS 175.79]|uniref:Zn(2)-C6 fungal-type domain-containing protein n=1 Tax=Aaosphaeria arxii CBS 175.79 TaxID=1450172 RepID=A0A6A5X965_9PLEO|nr:uncharacterized protein BU24DRAFT_428504 [Aaosphaeria arxii CBS 175.79]KAF2009605.1 hypothetical protein BU24DRAFT_428504 [Aaosphaeria arxii CBS 175.79]
MASRSLPPLLPSSGGPRKPPQPPPKRSRVSTACDSCRNRKLKCNGERPQCSQCILVNLNCHYRETETRAAKRKYEQLKAQRSTYEQIYSMLQTEPDKTSDDIYLRIRQGGDAASILNQLQDGDLLLQLSLQPETRYRYTLPFAADLQPLFRDMRTPFHDSTLFRSVTQPPSAETNEQEPPVFMNNADNQECIRNIPYHRALLTDAALDTDSTMISRWTSIGCDRKLLQKLLRTYFQFHFPLYPVFHKGIFLDELFAGGTVFCSSLLVNSILAIACHGIESLKNRSDFWLPQTAGYQFFAEAKRLWELEQEDPKLTTVQAACIMGLCHAENGMDKLAWPYWKRAIAMAKEMRLFSQSSAPPLNRESIVRSITAWALFSHQTIFAFHYFRSPLVHSPPDIPLPSEKQSAGWFGESWLKYSSTKEQVPLHLGSSFIATCELCEILCDIMRVMFQADQPDTFGRIHQKDASDFLQRLRQWEAGLPRYLSAKIVFLPNHLLLHMLYHEIVKATSSLNQISENSINTANLITHGNLTARAAVTHSNLSLTALVHMFYHLHGFESWYTYAFRHISVVGFTALESLHPTTPNPLLPEDKTRAIRATLLLCAKGLHDQGRNIYVSEMAFYLLREAMKEEATQLNFFDLEREQITARKALLKNHARTDLLINVASFDCSNLDKYRAERLIANLSEVESNESD